MPPTNARGAESYAVVITTMWASGNVVLIVEGLRKEVNDMDEYIKREDALDAVLFALVGTGYQSRALDAVRYVPAVDVTPRAEVAREIFEEIEKIVAAHYHSYKPTLDNSALVVAFNHSAKTSIATLKRDIAELKKKYTEGQK